MGAPLDHPDHCQFAPLRFGPEQLDATFRTLVDRLEAAYYQAWRQGQPAAWLGWQVQETPAASKAQFDRLHGLVWHYYTVVFDAVNQARPATQQLPTAKYRLLYAPDGQTVRRDKVQEAWDWIVAHSTAAEQQQLEAALHACFHCPLCLDRPVSAVP